MPGQLKYQMPLRFKAPGISDITFRQKPVNLNYPFRQKPCYPN